MINNELNFRYWQQEFAKRGRVQVESWLQLDAAQYLSQLLQTVPFTLAYRNEQNESQCIERSVWASFDNKKRSDFLTDIEAKAIGRYSFAYDSYQMVSAYQGDGPRCEPLDRLLEFLNSPDYLGFMRELTGMPHVRRIGAQATRYLPGHFLRRHDDHDAKEGRLVAYVMNLSPNWEADWGGLLHFHDEQDRIVDSFVPRFNTLSLFRVPVAHSVSRVCAYAKGPRLAITGWLML